MTDSDGVEATPRSGGSRGKVARLIEKYDLHETGHRLEDEWTASGSERRSLRELAEAFNHELLQTVMHQTTVETLDGEVENTYRLLTDDEVSEGMRTQTRRRLERAGVDVDQLMTEFASYQAIRTYLRNVRGASYERETTNKLQRDRETIRRLKNRTLTVTESKLAQLRDSDELASGELDVFIDLKAVCSACGSTLDVDTLLEDGACDCEASP
ncbi:rod-determining factor RdfA [Halomarina rubra]|uniref:Rod-determining factor RdfA n=1 Tax=Halomarina rubra TaxID=2071873 RepID=A0ABD6AQE6_9EURY|nr:rod-determining factor RdfA [Halomarina rubra]